MFRKHSNIPKETVEKIVPKCSFCRKKDSIGKVKDVYYCSESVCATKLWGRKKNLDDIEIENRQKREKKAIERVMELEKNK